MAAAAIPAIAGTVLTYYGQQQAGKVAEQNAAFKAAQLKRAAGLKKAESQRSALEIERQGKLQQSRALAVAAASGGGASDPTIVDHMARLAGETNYRKMVALYEGEDAANQLNLQAEITKREGKQQRQAANIASIGTALSEGSSLYNKYG